jgi:hypothetical protein
MALYAGIESALVAAAPVAFISHDKAAVLVKPRLQGYRLTPIGVPIWHLVTVSGP